MTPSRIRPLWFLARTAADRPALSHAMALPHDPRTLCGVPVAGWSRFFIERPLEMFSCKTCLKISGATTQSRLVAAVRAADRHLSVAR